MDLNVVQYIWQHNPGPFGEFRFIRDGKVVQDFYEKDEVNGTVVKNFSYAYDAYFGVLPRHNRSGKTADVPDSQNTLWADFDSKERTKEEAFRAVLSVRPVPQIIVDSGNGYHAYWMLQGRVTRYQAELTMKGIAIRHGGDRTYDAARVLRVPGTQNFKTDPPTEVRLLKFDTTVMYNGSDFMEYFQVGLRNTLPAFPEFPVTETPDYVAHGVLPSWLINLIENTGNKKGTRSEEAFKVVCHGIKRGYPAPEIEQWFKDHPQGIGQKYHEKRDGHRWFMVTFKAAQKSILSSKQRGF